MRRAGITVLTLLSLGSTLSRADDPPQKIDLNMAPAQLVDDVIIPIPQEVFTSLDKLGQQNWRGQIRNQEIVLDTSRSRSAILFGLVIAEGFIAVQAEDREEVKRIGREVLKVSGALGVKDDVFVHAQTIIDGADTGDWPGVRRELDRTRQTVIDTMERMHDSDFAEMVSIGGWLGGTHALASLLSANYNAEGSELLHQPDLVERMARRFEAIPPRTRKGRLLDEVGGGLRTLQTLMSVDANGAVSAEKVREIEQLTSSLTDLAYAR